VSTLTLLGRAVAIAAAGAILAGAWGVQYILPGAALGALVGVATWNE